VEWAGTFAGGAKMKKFMAIYMASGADFERMMKSSTPEQRSKGMEARGCRSYPISGALLSQVVM
jgi:hypothetical protein